MNHNELENMRISFIELKNLIKDNLDEIVKYRYEISLKNDNSPVTKSDLLMEKLILDFLNSKFDSIIFISEESYQGIKKFSKNQHYAIIDPIDGTENFSSGLKVWGIAISIWRYPVHVASLLYLPEMDQSIMTGDKINKITSRIHGFSSSMNNDIIDRINKQQENRITGCAVYNYFNVINGSFKTFSNPKGAYIWDLAAGINIALENNCNVLVEGKAYDGRFLNPNKKYCIEIINE
jgi:myo-inositol-1(or 4)-monophosphatase